MLFCKLLLTKTFLAVNFYSGGVDYRGVGFPFVVSHPENFQLSLLYLDCETKVEYYGGINMQILERLWTG
jgi:hypothetical protein